MSIPQPKLRPPEEAWSSATSLRIEWEPLPGGTTVDATIKEGLVTTSTQVVVDGTSCRLSGLLPGTRYVVSLVAKKDDLSSDPVIDPPRRTRLPTPDQPRQLGLVRGFFEIDLAIGCGRWLAEGAPASIRRNAIDEGWILELHRKFDGRDSSVAFHTSVAKLLERSSQREATDRYCDRGDPGCRLKRYWCRLVGPPQGAPLDPPLMSSATSDVLDASRPKGASPSVTVRPTDFGDFAPLSELGRPRRR